MGIEYLTVSVGGMSYSAFLEAEVHAAFNAAARDFSLEIAAELGASATNAVFKVGAEVTIQSNGDLLLTGFVDKKSPKIDAHRAVISVSGRSNSGDLVDSSAKHKTGRFEKKDPMQIGNEVSEGIGAKYTTDQQLEKIEQYQLNPGESTFRLVEKMARQQGLTITGTADGNAKITKAGSKRHSGGLIEGENMLTGQATHDGSNRHSEYTVRGQRPFGHGEDALEIEHVEKDSAVKRHRPLVLVQDEDTDKKRTKKRAKNRKNRAAGHALKATITTQGFRDEGGQLWEPGNLVWVESPFLDIAQDMLIESVTYKQSGAGSIASISLTDPRAYDGEESKGSKQSKKKSSKKDGKKGGKSPGQVISTGPEWDIGG